MMKKDIIARGAEMAARRINQRARVPGFTPVPNKRIDALYLRLLAEMRPLSIAMAQAEEMARGRLAAMLPPPSPYWRRSPKVSG